MSEDAGRLRALVKSDIGLDVDGLLAELEDVPKRVYAIRQKIAPMKAELAMLQARFESKGRSPSHWDIARSLLLSELKEEERVLYNRDPDFKESSRGAKTKVEMTDGRAEDRAHAHPRYRKFVEEAGAQLNRIADLGKLIGAEYDKIETWKGKKEFLLQKLKIAEGLIWAWGSEARLTPR